MISSEKQVIQHYVDTLLVKAVAELEERVVEQIKPNFFSLPHPSEIDSGEG